MHRVKTNNCTFYENATNQAFVQACFLLVDTSDEDAMARAKAGGGGPLDEQVTNTGL